ncbi:MAG: MFS transporter, partial [Lachnospiraceae bacterium]|nr:MFS transporter [Lachnospiraceae bacterium]
MGKTKEKNNNDRLGFGKLLLWNSRAVSSAIVTLMLGFLMIYCTDTLKVPPAYISVILVASKILD